MILDKKKFENYHCDQYRSKYDNISEDDIQTMSLLELSNAVGNMKKNALANNKKLDEVPVFITADNEMFCIEGTSISFGKLGICCHLKTETKGTYSDRVYYVAPDSRPEEGEYWTSRGIGGSDSNPDCSGFVKSKAAGERLLRMVKLVLETDEPKTWLDYRESEPNWIQFKFQGCEFNLEKLEELSKNNNNIITLDILKQCKVK